MRTPGWSATAFITRSSTGAETRQCRAARVAVASRRLSRRPQRQLLVGLLGGGNSAAAWAALTVAVAAQVGWATVATVRAGASGPLVLVTAVVNLVLAC